MSESIQIIIDKKNCSGCFLCMNICPQECIKIRLNKEGFYYPKIDKKKCNNCGICLEKCPVNIQYENKNKNEIHVYMAKSLDNKLKINSSSGGIFGEIARYIISQEGIVYGAIFNNENEVMHIGIEDKKDLYKLIGSKYLQSNMGFSYKDMKENLLRNRQVLFVGLPCQVNALRNYLGDNNNLILIDLVCHGVPSQTIFNKYIQYLFGNDVIKKVHFRDKRENRDWENFKIKIIGETSTYSRSHRKDAFFYGYLKNLYLNDICYSCIFSKVPRVSDITLGDFWGISEELKDKEGTSIVLTNSNKGEKLIQELYYSKNIQLIKTDIRQASKNNLRLISGQMSIPEERKEIFEQIENISFRDIDKLFIKSFNDDVYEHLLETIKSKKIVVFGTGSALDKILLKQQFISLENIDYLLDNDDKKQGNIIYNKMIYGIEKLKEENSEDIFIIIASSYYDEICRQLERIGLKENINFIDGIKYLLYD